MVSDWLNTSVIISKEAKKPCHRLNWCPYGKMVESFPVREQENQYSCKVFHHDCPVFYYIENLAEKYNIEEYEKEIEQLFNIGGLSEVFSNDKISEYWYQIGSAHSEDDEIRKLNYAIEKILEINPNLKDELVKLWKIIDSVSLEEIQKTNSHT
ncbi:MAG: hypothetical protein ACFE96_02550 [Candidatus Hermodarchaeota archaeon]